MDIKMLSEILGHKSPAITLNRYVHSFMDSKRKIMKKLGDAYLEDIVQLSWNNFQCWQFALRGL